MLNQLAQEIHENAKSKGFYDSPKNVGEMIALMHSELSEALEADREGKYSTGLVSAPNGEWMERVKEVDGYTEDANFILEYKTQIKGTFEEEMADIIIRALDFCGFKNIDISAHVKAKMRYNSLREHKHGKKY
jgi:NTP pyrophosphatase (non-canonical NTP hydrolase)